MGCIQGKSKPPSDSVKDDSDKPSSTISLDSYQATKPANKKDMKKGQPTLELTPKLQNGKKDAKKALFSAESQEELEKWQEAITKAMKVKPEPGAPLEHVTKTRARPQANKRRPPSRDHLRGKRIAAASTGMDLDISMDTADNGSPAPRAKKGSRPSQAIVPNRSRNPSGEILKSSSPLLLQKKEAASNSSLHKQDSIASSRASSSNIDEVGANASEEEIDTKKKKRGHVPAVAMKPPAKVKPTTENDAVEVDASNSMSQDDTAPEQPAPGTEEPEKVKSKPPPPPAPAGKPKFIPSAGDDADEEEVEEASAVKGKPPPIPSPAKKPTLELKNSLSEELEEEELEEASAVKGKPPPIPSPAKKPTLELKNSLSEELEELEEEELEEASAVKGKPPPIPSPAKKPSLKLKNSISEKSEEEEGACFTDDELDELEQEEEEVLVVETEKKEEVNKVEDCKEVIKEDKESTMNVNNCNSKHISTEDDIAELPSEVKDALDVLDEQLLDVSCSDSDEESEKNLAQNNTKGIDAR